MKDKTTAPDMASQVLFILQTGKRIHEALIINRARDLSKTLGENISLNQLHMIRLVYRLRETGVKELAEMLQVSAPSASAMVDRLVEQGLLSREQSPHDRRQVIIRLTPLAEKGIEKIENNIQKELEKLAEKIGPVTTAEWFRVMQKIHSVIEKDARFTEGRL